MTDAYIFDAVRTPRGRGKKDGGLHTVTPVSLMSGLLRGLQERHEFTGVHTQRAVIPRGVALEPSACEQVLLDGLLERRLVVC